MPKNFTERANLDFPEPEFFDYKEINVDQKQLHEYGDFYVHSEIVDFINSKYRDQIPEIFKKSGLEPLLSKADERGNTKNAFSDFKIFTIKKKQNQPSEILHFGRYVPSWQADFKGMPGVERIYYNNEKGRVQNILAFEVPVNDLKQRFESKPDPADPERFNKNLDFIVNNE